MESHLNTSSQAFNEIVQKLNSLEKKLNKQSSESEHVMSQSRQDNSALHHILRRYSNKNSKESGQKFDDLNKKGQFMEFDPTYKENNFNKTNQGLSDIYNASDKLLKNMQSSNNRESQFLNDFFGFSANITNTPEIIRVENSSVQFSQFKQNIISRLDRILDDTFIRNVSRSYYFSKTYHEEWTEFKTYLSDSPFKSRKRGNILWDSDIKKKELHLDIKNILELLHSKIRLMNLQTTDTNFRPIFDIDGLKLSMSQKSLLDCAVAVTEFMISSKINQTNRDALAHQYRSVEFALEYLSNSFLNFIKMNTKDNNTFFSRLRDSTFNPVDLIENYFAANLHGNYLQGSTPIWFIIYNLIRIREYSSAISVIKNLEPSYQIMCIVIESLISNMPLAFTREDIEDLNQLSKSRIKTTTDPYEHLLLCLFTFSHIHTSDLKTMETIEEFVWFKLLRLKLSILINSDIIDKPLETIRDELTNDFDKKSTSSIIFSQTACFFLVGAYEQGLKTLSHDDIGLVFAMHIAILFWKGGFLRSTIIHDDSLCIFFNFYLVIESDNDPQPQILNLGALMDRFFMRTSFSCKVSVLDYFIALDGVKSNTDDIFSYGASHIIKKFRQFGNILSFNWTESDDSNKFNPEYIKCGCALADYCSSMRENVVALSIYIKIGDITKSIICMTDVLTDLIVCPHTYTEATINDIESHGKFLGNKVLMDSTIQDAFARYFLLLLDLYLFFKEFRQAHYSKAIKIINALRIIPSKYSMISECLEKLRTYPRKLNFVYQHVLITTVILIRKMYEISKSEPGKIIPT
ncbi:hypothetical protein HZS_5562, partial [Henneguya salminicola]